MAIQELILQIYHFLQVFRVTVILIPILRKSQLLKKRGKDNEYPITLTIDNSTFKVTITLKTNYQLDLTKSNFYKLIGFDKKVLKTAGKK